MSIALRAAAPEDGAGVSALLKKGYSVLLKQAYGADLLEKALPFITVARPELLTSGTYYLAETREGRIVGAGGWTRQSPTGETEDDLTGHIRHFGIDPDFARNGIGRLLMDKCVKEATRAGLTGLTCLSTLNGEPFYAAFGFRAEAPFEVHLPGGITFGSIRMVKQLS
ncbi:GNAT family N-acetyltransferase [Roseibium sp.]|uniref:GNAT family N-acetyltransferase n=1 Tax=Roseibium sp. TaxID=1936156 RepID=UPI003D0CB03D